MTQSDPMFTAQKVAKRAHNGVAASRDAVEADNASSTGAARQARIRDLLTEAGPMGKTAKEIETMTGESHGPVSGALSAMHRDGLIAALKLDRRNGHGVYVALDQVGNRLVRPYQASSRGGRALRTWVDETKSAPVPASRPRLTPDEVALFAKVRHALVLNTPDKPSISLRPATVKALLDAVDRLNK